MKQNKRLISKWMIMILFLCFGIIHNVEAKSSLGYLDHAGITSNNQLSVGGWAYDQDAPTSAIAVRIYANNQKIGEFKTNTLREDVNKAYGISGNHGYSQVIDLSAFPQGTYTIQAKAISTSGIEYPLTNTFQVTVNLTNQQQYHPVGCVDMISYDMQGIVKVAGWAFDKDAPTNSLQIKVYNDTTLLGTLNANNSREDVNKAYSISGSHGFSGVISYKINKGATIIVKAVDLVTNKEYEIGSKNIVLTQESAIYTTKYQPIGCIDRIISEDGYLKIAGWAYDLDSSATSIKIKVYLDTTCISTFNADTNRTDVNKAYAITGWHGFNQMIKTNTTGSHMITIKAVDLQSNIEYTLGSKTITLQATNTSSSSNNINQYLPIGCIDSLTCKEGGIIQISGWAFDRDSSNTSINIKAYIEENCIATLTTNQLREDVNNVYHITGTHGFSANVPTNLTGNRTVVLKAIDLQSNKEYIIGSKEVTILANHGSTVTTNYLPRGCVDVIISNEEGKVELSGWAYDQDQTNSSLSIKVYIQEECIGTIISDVLRNDVNKAFNIIGNHGFKGILSTKYVGNQTITIKAVDLVTNKESIIGIQTINILGNDNQINFDEKIVNYIKEHNLDVSVGYYNLATGKTFYYREGVSYYGASLIKTLDALYLYDKNLLTPELKNYLTNAISKSDNESHMQIVRSVGVNALSEYGKSLGANNDLSIYDYYGNTTVLDQMVYMKKLYELSNNNSEMKNMFINDYYNCIKVNSLTTMHKYGWYDKVFHDAGIIFDKQPYILVVLTNYGQNANRINIIHDLSDFINQCHNA